MRKILYISGTRADFGLMEECLQKIHQHPGFTLGILVTGMHFLPEYGETCQEIVKSGLDIVDKVPVSLSGSSSLEMASAVGKKISAFSEILAREQPDLLLLLGDRGEMLAGAIAAVHLNIPIVHIHGGERSGTIDESIRHAISKFAHYHLVATEGSRERLIKMGERPDMICVTGAPGLDSISRLKLTEKEALFKSYSLNIDTPLVLVLFHPVVQQACSLSSQIDNLLSVVLELDMQVLVLMPNADAGGGIIREEIAKFHAYKNLKTAVHIARNDFLSLVAYSEVLVGNSSCGIIEAASLSTPVLNIGSRQNFRERNHNVIDADVGIAEIRQGLDKALALRGREWSNIYGNGRASDNIVHFLENVTLDSSILEKVNAY